MTVERFFALLFRILPCCLVVCLSSAMLRADDDGPEETEEEAVAPLKIKSQTKLWSADYYINGERAEDKERDRERTDIGIGEQITLLLVGKPKGVIKGLSWSSEGEGFEQKGFDQFLGAQEIILLARQDLTKDASVKVTVKTSEGIQKTFTVNIKVPSKIVTEKYEGMIVGPDGVPYDTKEFKIPPMSCGVVGFIEATLHPTNVSFIKTTAIEKDGGLEWKGKSAVPPAPRPVLAAGHAGNGAGKVIKVKDKNTFHDVVLYNADLMSTLNTIRASNQNPQVYWWVCDLHVYLEKEKKETILLNNTNQLFYHEIVGRSSIKTVIEKHGIKFEEIH